MKKIASIALISLFMSGCTGSKQPGQITPNSPQGHGTTKPLNTTPSKKPETILGTGSGGGGFIDEAAKQALEVAKNSLASMITNTDDSVFSNFPKEKGKSWIIEVIKNIEIVNLPASRYNRKLKFNYDKNKSKIFATKHFVETFDYGRFSTKPYSEQLNIVGELYIDILHELSHFYDIGTNEESDQNSELWAIEFFALGIGYEKYSCSTKFDDKDFSIILNPASGFARYGYNEPGITDINEDDSPMLSIPFFDEEKDIEIENMMLQINKLSLEKTDKERLIYASTFMVNSLEFHSETQHIFDSEILGIPEVVDSSKIKFISKDPITTHSSDGSITKVVEEKIASLDKGNLTLTYKTKLNNESKTLELACHQSINSIRIKEFVSVSRIEDFPEREENID